MLQRLMDGTDGHAKQNKKKNEYNTVFLQNDRWWLHRHRPDG